jgi:hypothetical protein
MNGTDIQFKKDHTHIDENDLSQYNKHVKNIK